MNKFLIRNKKMYKSIFTQITNNEGILFDELSRLRIKDINITIICQKEKIDNIKWHYSYSLIISSKNYYLLKILVKDFIVQEVVDSNAREKINNLELLCIAYQEFLRRELMRYDKYKRKNEVNIYCEKEIKYINTEYI